MASSLGSLVVRLGLDAGDYTAGLSRAEQQAQRYATTTERSMRTATRAVDEHAGSLKSLERTLKGAVGAFGVSELVRLSDEYQNANARLSIFTSSQEHLASLQTQLFGISQNTRQSLSGTVDLYYQLANATQDVGVSERDLLRITDGINKALIISGAAGTSARGAIVQLSQALAAGKLRGQEFNTVNEQANRIMRALGDGLGKTVGQLREMSNEGEITTDVFVEGFSKGLERVDAEFAKIPVTISGAMTVAQNELQRFIGTTFQSAGQTTVLANGILLIAKNIDVLIAAALGFGVTKLADVFLRNVIAIEQSITSTVAEAAAVKANRAVKIEAVAAEVARLQATEATIVAARAQTSAELVAAQATGVRTAATRAHTVALIADLAMLGKAQATTTAQLATAQASLATAQAGTTASATVLSRALGFLGGPIGAVTTALGLGIAAWQLWSSKSEEAAVKAQNAMSRSTQEIVNDLDKQIEKLKQRAGLIEGGGPEAALARGGGERAEKLAELRARAEALRKTGSRPDLVEAITLDEMADRLANKLRTVSSVQRVIEEGGQKEKYKKYLRDLATDTEKLNAELAKAKEELGPLFDAEIEKRIRDKYAKKNKGGVDDPTRKILDGQLKALEANIAREKDLLSGRESFLRDTYEDGLLSVENYYNQLQDARNQALQSTLAYYDQEALAIERSIQTAKKLTDQEDLRNKLDDVRAKQDNARRDAANNAAGLDRDRQKATQAYIDQLTELNAKVLEIKGNTAEAAILRFEIQNRTLGNLLRSSDNLEGQAQLAIIREQLEIQSQLTDVYKEYSIAVGYAEIAQERLGIAQATGAISELDMLYQTSAANKEKLAILQRIATAYAAIAERSRDPADMLKAEQIKLELEKVAAATDLVADKFNKLFAEEFANSVVDVVTGTKSISQAFKDMGKSITKAIADIAAQNIATALFGKGGPASGVGGFFSQMFGGSSEGSLLSWLFSLLGGGSGGGLGYGTIGSNIPAGPFPYADGTAFHPGGMALVGERGPELVQLPRGSSVTPNKELKKMFMGGITVNINVPQSTTTASARQIGAAARDGIIRAIKDR